MWHLSTATSSLTLLEEAGIAQTCFILIFGTIGAAAGPSSSAIRWAGGGQGVLCSSFSAHHGSRTADWRLWGLFTGSLSSELRYLTLGRECQCSQRQHRTATQETSFYLLVAWLIGLKHLQGVSGNSLYGQAGLHRFEALLR